MMSAGWSLHRGRGLLVVSVLVLVGAVIAGCTQLGTLIPRDDKSVETGNSSTVADKMMPSALHPSADGTGVTSCGLSLLTGSEYQAAVQEALNNPKVQSLQQELRHRGFTVIENAALAFRLDSEKLVYLPAGPTAGIVYETYLGVGYAVAAIQEGDKTVNIRPDRGVRHMTGFDPKTRDKLFRQLRNSKQIRALEKSLKKQDQFIVWSQSVLFVDTDGGSATIGLAVKETNSARAAWFGYRVEATLKGRKLTVQSVKAEACAGIGASLDNGKGKEAIVSQEEKRDYKEAPAFTPRLFTDPNPIVTIVGSQLCVAGSTGTTCITITSSMQLREAMVTMAKTLLTNTRTYTKQVPSLLLWEEGLFLYGFDDLTPEVLEALLQGWEAYQARFGAAPILPAAVQISANDVINALKELKPYLNAPNFAQMVEQMKQKYPGFAQFMLYLSVSTDSQLQQVKQLVTDMSGDPTVEQLTIQWLRIKVDLVNKGIVKFPGENDRPSTQAQEDPFWRAAKIGALIEYLTNVALGITQQANLSSAEAKKMLGELINLFEQLGFGDGTINAGIWAPTGMSISQAINKMIENLLNTIPAPGLEFNPFKGCPALQIPCLIPPTVEQVKAFMRIVEIALATIDKGWKLVNLGFPIPGVSGNDTGGKVRVSVIVTKENAGGIKGTVTAFIKDYSIADTSVNQILSDVEAITKFIKDNSANGQFFPKDGTNVVVVVINFAMSDDDYKKLISELDSRSNGKPVIVVRNSKATCVANCTGIDATKLAIDLGLIVAESTEPTVPIPEAIFDAISANPPGDRFLVNP